MRTGGGDPLTGHARSRAASAVGLLLAAALTVAPGPAAAAPSLPLGHEGRWITDSQGRVVILHGLNLVAKGEPRQPADRGFGADDLELFAREGFNTVRLGIDYAAIEPAPGAYDEAFIDRYAQTVALAGSHGVLALVDLHQDLYSEKYGSGNGLPAWMAIDDGLPEEPNPGFPGAYFTSPAINRAYDNLWANAPAPDGMPLQDHYAEGLRRIAARLAGEDRMVGYDIFNEPWPGSEWPTCANPAGCPPGGFDQTELTDFSKRAFAGIRRADRRHLAFYEPNLQFDVGAATGHGDTGDELAGFSFHNYCLGAAPGFPRLPDPTGIGCETNEQVVFDNAEAQSERTGDTLLMTEFGLSDDPGVVEQYLELADRNMVGWHYWTYADLHPGGGQTQFGSVLLDISEPPTPDNLRQGHLDVLARAYPQVVAGTPLAYDFDRASGRFELAYSTAAPGGRRLAGGADAITEVFLPERHYAEGYRVAVAGAEVVSEPGARLLRLRACPGAERVELAVTADSPLATGPCVDGEGAADGSTPSGGGGETGDRPAAEPVDVAGSGSEPGAPARGASAGAQGALPFTGALLVPLLALGGALAAVGIALRRRAR